MLVESTGLRGRRSRIDDVADKFSESDVVPTGQGFFTGICPVLTDDLTAEARAKVFGTCVVRVELVPISRYEPFEGVPDEHELEVVIQPVTYFLAGVIV